MHAIKFLEQKIINGPLPRERVNQQNIVSKITNLFLYHAKGR